MYSLDLNAKITNWNDIPDINGIIIDRYRFEKLTGKEIKFGYYGVDVYACRCGMTFASHYSICPKCGNRHFVSKTMYDVKIENNLCMITPYRYAIDVDGKDFCIIKRVGDEDELSEIRADYKLLFEKHPELFNNNKYKNIYDIAMNLDGNIECAWYVAQALAKLIYNVYGVYDLDKAIQVINMFKNTNDLASFVRLHDANRMIAFLSCRTYDNELVKRVGIHDYLHGCDRFEKMPNVLIDSASKGNASNIAATLLTADEMLNKYGRNNDKTINILAYYLENCHQEATPTMELPIFMGWAMNTTEEVTMKKFYWYMNAKHIQKAASDNKFEKALASFDANPVAAIIKLSKV